MFCPKCGTQNPENGKFCRSCGTDLGNVSAALSGSLKPPMAPMAPMLDRKGKHLNWESAFGKVFMGLAFLIVSIVLSFTHMGRAWWFWMLIPAFGMLGSGLAQCIQLKKYERIQGNNLGSQPLHASTKNEFPVAAAPTVALPPTQTDYVKPQQQKSIYDTGELASPPSVTEDTTRHLEVNNEGETMTLPKK
jgi:hypothetical protein